MKTMLAPPVHQIGEAGLVKRPAIGIEHGDLLGVAIDACNVVPHLCQARAHHQADVAQANDRDFHDVLPSPRSEPGSGACCEITSRLARQSPPVVSQSEDRAKANGSGCKTVLRALDVEIAFASWNSASKAFRW
jgi:hypothetical protein